MKFFSCIKAILLNLVIGILVTPIVFADILPNAKPIENKIRFNATHSEMIAASPFQAPAHYRFTEINSSQFSELSQTEQQTVALVWGLSARDYAHYLALMEETPDGFYYRDQHLDPSWILGMNAKNEEDRKKYVTLAILHERERMAKLLRFQQMYDQLQHELFPHNQPIQFDEPKPTLGVPITCRKNPS